MKIVFVKEIIHSNKKNQDFYVIRYALINEKKETITKSEPLLWVSKDVYDNLNI